MTVRRVVALDLWTDANRGDEVLQAGLIELLRRAYPDAAVTGVFRFGTNELADAKPEIASTVGALDEALGGIRRTHYAGANSARHRGVIHAFVSLMSFLEAVACIIGYRVMGRRVRFLIGAHRSRTMQVLRNADVVVWKGKNFREYHGLTGITRSMTLTCAGWFAGMLRDEVHCVNASFWRIDGRVQRSIYRRAFHRCRSITVRDAPSVDNVGDLLGPDAVVQLRADLSLVMVGERGDRVRRAVTADAAAVALTVTEWGPPAQQAAYLDALEAAIVHLRTVGARSFVVVPQVIRVSEDSSAIVAALRERLRRSGIELEVLEGPLSVDDLFRTYARHRLLLGARMHSCVFARAVGVPFVALSYDSGPKWDVLSQFWPAELILPYGAPTSRLVAAAERAWIDGDGLVAASQARWERLIVDASMNLSGLDG